MDIGEAIAGYHDLWAVQQSFQMFETDLRTMFHHKRESIEAHLTIVFAALAVARHRQQRNGISIKVVTTLRPPREVTITVAPDHHRPAQDPRRHPVSP